MRILGAILDFALHGVDGKPGGFSVCNSSQAACLDRAEAACAEAGGQIADREAVRTGE